MIPLPFPVPSAPDWRIDWNAVSSSPFGEVLRALDGVRQNPAWHGEGDARIHTERVCESLTGDPAFRETDEQGRAELFAAALLHDAGKISKTRLVDGVWTSPGHAAAGARAARKLLWQAFDLAGSEEKRRFRETVCALVQFHSLPIRFVSRPEPERLVQSVAAEGCAVPGFSLRKLATLVRADICGREAGDTDRLLDELALFAATAEERGCLDAPPAFSDPFSRFAWLEGRTAFPEQSLYNDTWGKVYLTCALPGTGKDTWIRQTHPELPVVSLDAIRAEIGIAWEDAQGPVVALAFKRARELLRAKRPFVWNATSLTPDLRDRELRLFRAYGAFTEIVMLETPWREGLRRNRERKAVVPETVIDAMLDRFTPPSVREAHEISFMAW